MFWGLIMEPQRRYSQSVKRAFHISMAALDESTSDENPTQVICSFDDRNYLLCTLEKGKTLQVPLDLNYEIGDEISFATNGKAHIHLTGYLLKEELSLDEGGEEEEDQDHTLINELPMKRNRQKSDFLDSPSKKKSKTLQLLEAINSNDEDDSDDSDVNMSDLIGEDDATTRFLEAIQEEDDEAEQEDEDSDEDIASEDSDEDSSSLSGDEQIAEFGKKLLENGVTGKRAKKIAQTPDNAEKQHKQERTPVKPDRTPRKGVEIGKIKKTPGKGDKTPGQGNKTPAKSPKQQQDGGRVQKCTVEGGVIIEDIKVGNGPVAKPGKFIKVLYEGRLKSNNKIFDATTKGAGFEFRLGRQEVINGWDVGIAGMKVGGKRKIICPPNMAYGQKGYPPTIPPNSTLVFEVELKNVK